MFLGHNLSFSAAAEVPENRYAAAGIENAAEFEAAFSALQAAVAANDKGKVADSVFLPLRVSGWTDENSNKSSLQVSSRQELMDKYDEIFTAQVKEAFARQKIAELFVNWQGVMVGKGEVWLSVSDRTPVRYGILSVNLGI